MKNCDLSRYGLVTLFVGSLVAMALWALGIGGFGPIDDHQFIRTIFEGREFGAYVMPELGRFVPLTAQEYVLAAKMVSPSPHLFHVISTIKMLLVGVLLFHCLILTRASDWAVAILWSIAFFSIGFANATLRLQVGELNALLLILLFVWSALASDTAPLSTRKNIGVIGGFVAFAIAFLYKELIFVCALAFGASEYLRYYRQTQVIVPRRILALIILGVTYIAIYGLWHALYTTASYVGFHSMSPWEAGRRFATNDPFMIFIVLPLTAFRLLVITRDVHEHTVYDSFLVAATAYVGSYLALGIYNTYYLLPAYGFSVCGVAGVLASRSVSKSKPVVLAVAGLFCANTLPIAVADMQALKAIANNHYQFVRYISEWLWLNPMLNSEPRNLVLMGVSPGSGVEILVSFRTFLLSLGAPESSFLIRTTEPDNNPKITSFYRRQELSQSEFKDELEYTNKKDDLLIFNPYQQVFLPPPHLAPSYQEVYRSASEWALPRWSAWHWIRFCVFNLSDCASRISGNLSYVGYAAMLVKRQKATVRLIPLKVPSYRIGILGLPVPVRMRAGIKQKIDVLVRNTGIENWPADGRLSPGIFVHMAYRWFNEGNQVVLEGDRVPLPEPMQPTDCAKVAIILKTPRQPGNYNLVISPVQEGVRWFPYDAATAKKIQIY